LNIFQLAAINGLRVTLGMKQVFHPQGALHNLAGRKATEYGLALDEKRFFSASPVPVS
jgi:hypothetical protein